MRGLLFTERIVETLPATCDWNWFVDGLWFVPIYPAGCFGRCPRIERPTCRSTIRWHSSQSEMRLSAASSPSRLRGQR
jgi:hypothetical protein